MMLADARLAQRGREASPAPGRRGPRVLAASNYSDGMTLYNGLCYEFCRVISHVSDADICAPPARPATMPGKFLRDGASYLRQMQGRPRLPRIATTKVSDRYDLFFYVCMLPKALADLKAIEGWRDRCKTAAAFIFETWSSALEAQKANLKLLDQFDHVFVYNRASIPALQRYTSAPCSFLPAGADCLTATPYPDPPGRPIDVYSMGRRLDSAHKQLLDLAKAGEIFYVFDPGSGLRVYDFAESRFLTLNYIKRSRYFMAYSLDVGPKAAESAGEQAIATRLFEGAAGGSIVLGTTPSAPEFHDLFDWPDAVVDIPAEPTDMRAILSDLDAQPERMARARRMNALQSLRRHDWVYRWEQILTKLGFDPTPGIQARRKALSALADRVEQQIDR